MTVGRCFGPPWDCDACPGSAVAVSIAWVELGDTILLVKARDVAAAARGGNGENPDVGAGLCVDDGMTGRIPV